ncbi:MAG TPA: cupin-like domain-containing protein, partial [Candidatus Binatia bacterium]|nr:cupin-like domain-containing protein [Candidatus Binatia bacterium]
ARRGRAPAPPAVERAHRPSMERFAGYRRRSVPVVLDGLADDWPARSNWSLARLRERFGNRPISVITTSERGVLCTDVKTGVAFRTMRFGDYVDVLERGERPDAYLIEPGSNWIPELRDDVRVPEYCRDAPWQNTRFWLSAADTAAPLHRDLAENLFFQLVGRKRFFLYPPSSSPWLYSNPFRSALPNYSRFDPEQPDWQRFPLARAVAPIELVLEPGDALYLPSRWWHQVRSLDVSASFNFWWADGVLALVVRAAEFVKRKRGLEIYGLESRRRGYELFRVTSESASQ